MFLIFATSPRVDAVIIPQPSPPVSVAPTRCIPRVRLYMPRGPPEPQHPTAVTPPLWWFPLFPSSAPTLTTSANTTAPSVSRAELPLRAALTDDDTRTACGPSTCPCCAYSYFLLQYSASPHLVSLVFLPMQRVVACRPLE